MLNLKSDISYDSGQFNFRRFRCENFASIRKSVSDEHFELASVDLDNWFVFAIVAVLLGEGADPAESRNGMLRRSTRGQIYPQEDFVPEDYTSVVWRCL